MELGRVVFIIPCLTMDFCVDVLLLTLCVFHTALKDSSERSINSDWKIELPGEFELAGTTVRYVRRGLWEKMSAKGPTKTPLHLMVSTLVTWFCVGTSECTRKPVFLCLPVYKLCVNTGIVSVHEGYQFDIFDIIFN